MFSPWTAPHVNFWLMMSLSAIFLISSALYSQRETLSEIYIFKPSYIFIGLAGAFVLYMVFMLGNFLATKLFSFAQGQVNRIYDLRNQSTPLVVGVLVFLIGSAEEVFWRGFVQQSTVKRLGPVKGYLAASVLYALVHIWSFNFMLVMASLVCGLFWGLIYLRYRSLWPAIISHVVWDLFIFVLLPIR